MKQITARIPEDLHRAVKVKVAKTGGSITEVINKLLRKWVEEDHEDNKSANMKVSNGK